MTKRAITESHTVQVAGGAIFAGLLVRSASSRRVLGYIWQAGNAWRWRTDNGMNYGERSSKQAAIDVLCDAADVRALPEAFLPFADIPTPSDADMRGAWTQTVERIAAPETRERRPEPKPVITEERINWNDAAPAFDVTAAVRDGLSRKAR